MNPSWQQRITDLEDSGLTLTELAEQIGLAKSTLSEVKRGATKAPSGDAAVALYLLHKKRCGRGRKAEAMLVGASDADPQKRAG